MGIYRYTLRATTKRVGGVDIAQFKFAYKCFWAAETDPVCRRLEAAGDRAAKKLQGVRLFVKGSWGEDQTIYWFDQPFGALTEEPTTCPVVGHLRKDGRGRWYRDMLTNDQLLAAYPEIGTLQTDEGLVYYHTIGGSEMRSPILLRVATSVLINRLREQCRPR